MRSYYLTWLQVCRAFYQRDAFERREITEGLSPDIEDYGVHSC